MARHERDQELERSWRRRLREHKQSGRTVRDFCRIHQLPESSFHFWRRNIEQRDRERVAKRAPAFVPVTLVEAKPMASPIDIHLTGGRRVRVRPGCDRELLALVLAVLEARAC